MRGKLAFTREVDVVADDERAGLRALPVPVEADPNEAHDVRKCELIDLSRPDVAEPGLETAGFETVDLSSIEPLQRALATVGEEDHLSDSVSAAIRASLEGARLPLAGGRCLRIVHVADDGMFHRRAGPNGLRVNPTGIVGANGHDGALNVHADQDVYGTPLLEMMNGGAPDLFRHFSPDGQNPTSDTLLLNLWIPVHQPVRPLALMDRRSLDASRHQLRYGLRVDPFLERDEDMSVNDIWTFLHDDSQRWYFRSVMGPDQGYVFDTLGTPHGSPILSGEDALERLYLSLRDLLDAFDRGEGVEDASPGIDPAELSDDATPAIREAFEKMSQLVEAASAAFGASRGDDDPAAVTWSTQARDALSGVIRRSVELRLVAALGD